MPETRNDRRVSAAIEDIKMQPDNRDSRVEDASKPSLLRRAMNLRVGLGSSMNRDFTHIRFESLFNDKEIVAEPVKGADRAVSITFPGQEKFERARQLPWIGKLFPKYAMVNATVPESGPVILSRDNSEMPAKEQLILGAQLVMSKLVIHRHDHNVKCHHC